MAAGTSGHDRAHDRGRLDYAWLVPVGLATAATVLLAWSGWLNASDPAWPAPGAWWWSMFGPRQEGTLPVIAALWLASLAAYWWPRRLQRRPITLIAIVAMVILGGVLAAAALTPCRGGDSHAVVLGWLLSLYLGNQPPALPGAGCSGPTPLAMQLGEIFCPGATLIGALAVGAVLWREPVGRLRSRFARDATVFTGLDPLTLPLLRQLAQDARSPRRIIVIEPDEDHPLLDEARLTGARVIIGNPASGRLLRPIISGVRGCALRQLYALGRKVQENEAVVAAAARILRRYQGDLTDMESQPHLVALIDDPRHADAWRGSHGGASDGWFEDALSSVESTACGLVGQLMATGARELLLCGDSGLALATLIELARRAWELAQLAEAADIGRAAMPTAAAAPPPMPVERVLLLDLKAEAIRREYLAIVPLTVLAAGPDVVPQTVRWHERLLDTLAARERAGDGASTAVIIVDDHYQNSLHEGGRVARLHPHTPIFVLASPGEGSRAPIFGRLTSFERGLLIDSAVPEDIWTRIARHWHEYYRLSRPVGPGDPRTGTRLPWAELDEANRQVNIHQLRSILTQVVRLGRQWAPVRQVPPGSFIELSDGEIEQVAKAAHTRWYRERLAQGWSPVPPGQAANRTNELLVPWEQLPEEERTGGKERARTQLTQLEDVGFLPIVPSGGPRQAQSFERDGEVHARRLTAPLRWTLPSGEEMLGQAGDWRVVDAAGMMRTVADPEFRSSHLSLGAGRYRRTGTLRAWPVSEAVVIRTKEGNATARPGDWVVEGSGGERWPVSQDQFQASYRARAERPDTAGQASTAAATSSTTAPTISS